MECNKDEALRAKEIAEKHFGAKDYLGAKKFALKAQSLYASLEGIQHMLTTLEVFISSENRINGEKDWYKVLDISPNADEETVKKQFKKLALVLHPDKNKSIGADGAFNLISEACNILSDKTKRLDYDQKINIKVVKSKIPRHGSNGVGSSNKSATNPKTSAQKGKTTNKRNKTPNGAPNYQQNYQISPTFWTVCHRCRLHHEYLRIYVNKNLLCPGCNVAYYSEEYPPPLQIPQKPFQNNYFQQNQPEPQIPQMPFPNNYFQQNQPEPQIPQMPFQNNYFQQNQAGSQIPKMPFQNIFFPQKQAESVTGSSSSAPFNQTNIHFFNPFFKTSGGQSADQAATMAQQEFEKVNRERMDATRREIEENLKRKISGSKREAGSASDANAAKKRKTVEDVKTKGSKTSNKAKNSRDSPIVEDPKILVDKAKFEIRKKLNEWKSLSDAADYKKRKQTAIENGKLNDFSKKDNQKNSELKAISVPDSDFHDFDNDRMETCFGENQVWAIYDDDDGMPRYYAIIHEVISVNPFKLRISWLNSKANTELNWVSSGLTKTLGEFLTGKSEINGSLNSFSHKVGWTEGKEEGIISVFPKKGDVWALYRNWSPKWNKLTEDKIKHKYDMVEVLEDYDEELGVRVSPLIKVAGFKTVFHWDEKEIKTIKKEEIFRFSHQVPSVSLSGQEGENIPKGCRELDPAATPLELLRVVV